MENPQSVEFQAKEGNRIELEARKIYAAPKLTKLGKLAQIVNSNFGNNNDGGSPPYNAT